MKVKLPKPSALEIALQVSRHFFLLLFSSSSCRHRRRRCCRCVAAAVLVAVVQCTRYPMPVYFMFQFKAVSFFEKLSSPDRAWLQTGTACLVSVNTRRSRSLFSPIFRCCVSMQREPGTRGLLRLCRAVDQVPHFQEHNGCCNRQRAEGLQELRLQAPKGGGGGGDS